MSKGESLKTAGEGYITVGLERSYQDTGVCCNCFLVLVPVDENGWRLHVFRQVMDGPLLRAEARNWSDSIYHREQEKLERNEAAEIIQLKSMGWAVMVCFYSWFSSG